MIQSLLYRSRYKEIYKEKNMYLFLGGDVSVKEDSVIGVFDMDNTTVAKSTRDFLARAQRNESVINVTDELPKSFCLAVDGGKETVYISQVAPATIKKRLGAI